MLRAFVAAASVRDGGDRLLCHARPLTRRVEKGFSVGERGGDGPYYTILYIYI